MADTTPLPPLENVTNFRELGGIATRDGRRVRRRRLFRSGHWGGASPGDVAALEQLGVGLVLDFRSDHDVALEGPDQLPAGTRHVSLATVDPAAGTDLRVLIEQGDLSTLREQFGDGGAHEYMRRGAAKLVSDRTEPFGQFLAHLCEPDVASALFHCSAGKDRAGWAASTVLLALGVEEKTVSEHYLLSNAHFEPDQQRGWRPPSEIRELLQPLVRVEAAYFEASLEAVHETFGGLDGYFRDGLGLSDRQLEQLRSNWLEEESA